ncbi:gelsolin-like protein 1 [Amphiura filiformis]|uniref:gelsolin-like protein 1 n=1 Tax=Amphiura filiformis TaxID=82378 RepID=UPI003B21FA6B
MSGLVKAKKYDWKDSNLALFGSDTDKKVKKDSAETEPAWQGAGANPGLQIWRIVKFKVEHWDKDQYGSFYSGDSYILLNTYQEPDNEELLYDVHFWIGQHSTQDEYGTAAYKTVELDTLLDDKPVQHREVQGHESALFKTYFKSITLMKGGADTGFRHVEPEKYKPRLLQFSGKGKNISVKEVPFCQKSLDDTDVFILDAGLKYYQWNGSKSNHFERLKAAQYLQKMKETRPKAEPASIEAGEKSRDATEFMDTLPQENQEEEEDDEEDEEDGDFTPSLYRLSNASGKLEFQLECEVPELPLPASKLDSSDVFIADTGKECFVWVGKGADDEESKNGMTYAHNYLQKSSHPLVPVSIVKEGREPRGFKQVVRN